MLITVRFSFRSCMGRLSYRLFMTFYVIKREGLRQVSGRVLGKIICALNLGKSSLIPRKRAIPKTGRYTVKVLLPHSSAIKMGKEELQELLSSRKQLILNALRKKERRHL